MPLWMKQFFIYHKDRFVSISGDWNLIILSIPIPGIVYLTITFLLDIVPLHFIQAVIRVFQPGTLNPEPLNPCLNMHSVPEGARVVTPRLLPAWLNPTPITT